MRLRRRGFYVNDNIGEICFWWIDSVVLGWEVGVMGRDLLGEMGRGENWEVGERSLFYINKEESLGSDGG